MGQKKQSTKLRDTYIYPLTTLATPFDVLGGRLIIAASAGPSEGFSFPMEMWEHLFLDFGTSKIRVESLAQLRGQVRIVNGDGAIGFVGLLTNASTYFLFPRVANTIQIDIVDKGDLRHHLNYGTRGSLSFFDNGNCGVLSHRDYVVCGIPNATSVRLPDGFRVERPVVSFDLRRTRRGEATSILQLRHKVGFDGTITDLGAVDLGRKALTGHYWTYPTFE